MLAPELTANYSISLAEMGYAPSAKLLAVRPLDTPAAPSGGWASRPGTVAVTAKAPLAVRACGLDDFEQVLLAP